MKHEGNGSEDGFVERARRLLHIDPHQLEKEWLDQAELYFQFDVDSTRADAEVERARANIDLEEAKLAKAIRRSPEEYGLDPRKVSETAISSVVVTLPEYQAAIDAHIEAKYEAGVRRAAMRSAEHRKKALEKTVDMLLAGFWSFPRNPPGVGRDLENVERREVRRGKSRA